MGRVDNDNDDDDRRRLRCSSSSSSIDSNANSSRYRVRDCSGGCSHSLASCSTSSGPSTNNSSCSKDLSTDLSLGLTISSSSLSPTLRHHFSSSSLRGQEEYSEWAAIKPWLRRSSTLADSLFVKVYMDGIPIGRKLNLLDHLGYHSLITTLAHMFRTTILFPDVICHNSSEGLEGCHILTYEDKEGDWMMVGDVPWELFLTTVKRLKIATFY